MVKLINIKRIVGFSLVSLIVAALTIAYADFSKAQEVRPNILFILTDDLDAAAVEYMPQVKSLIADRGVSFSNYFVNISLCCPSRASILRGQYAHNTGVFTNNKVDGNLISAGFGKIDHCHLITGQRLFA